MPASRIARDAEAVVASLRDEIESRLGSDLVALYVYGSAITGGFEADVSDVDMVAVTSAGASELALAGLAAAHDAVLAAFPGWADRIEIVYVGRRALERFRDEPGVLAVVSPGEPLHLSGPVRDWLQNWFLVRETGLAVVGPPPLEVLPTISDDEFLAGVRSYAAYLADMVGDAGSPGALAYAVLSACRAARTISTGHGCSKQEGAAWMRDRHPGLGTLIEEALATRAVRGQSGFGDPALWAAARALVRDVAAEFAIDRIEPS